MGGGIHGNFGKTLGMENAIAGNAVFQSGNKLYFENISKRKDIDPEGRHDFVAHGTIKEVQVNHQGKDVLINSKIAAKLLLNRKDYKKGQPIRLLSCETGKGSNSFAQNLANKLGVTVYAPSDYIWATKSGGHFIAAKKSNSKNLEPDISKKGRFIKFIPGGNVK